MLRPLTLRARRTRTVRTDLLAYSGSGCFILLCYRFFPIVLTTIVAVEDHVVLVLAHHHVEPSRAKHGEVLGAALGALDQRRGRERARLDAQPDTRRCGRGTARARPPPPFLELARAHPLQGTIMRWPPTN